MPKFLVPYDFDKLQLLIKNKLRYTFNIKCSNSSDTISYPSFDIIKAYFQYWKILI